MASGISSMTSAGSGAASGVTADAKSIASNFTQFLTLLTTQLKNQNPLDPMDTNQFTQQLVQFAGVEQQLKTNDRLDSILSSSKASSISQASGFVGQTVSADGKTAPLEDGSATWTLTPARAAKQAFVTILDAKGNVVATKTQALTTGAQSFSWDGRGATGLTQPNGLYSIRVDATDATGAKVDVDLAISGKVDSVDLDGAEPVLIIGEARVPISSVKAIGGGSGGGSGT